MKVRELVQPSSTCDTRGHTVATASAEPVGAPSTPIDVDLRTAAAGMRRRGTSTLLVFDGDLCAGVVTIEDLLRGALVTGDQQLCRDLTTQMGTRPRTPRPTGDIGGDPRSEVSSGPGDQLLGLRA